MTEAGTIAPLAPRAAVLSESAAVAAMLSAAAHAGLILWAVSGAPSREETLSAGGSVTVQVELVQGPEQMSSGGAASHRPDRAVSHDGEPPKGGGAPGEIREAAEDASASPAETNTPSARAFPSPLVAAHHAADPEAAVQADIPPRPVPPPAPRPPTNAADPVPSHEPTVAGSEQIAAGHPGNTTVVTVTADTGRSDTNGSAMAPDATDGSREMQGAAPSADNPAPDYPPAARQRGQYGRVVLRVEVSPNGDAETVQVEESSGYDALDRAASDAVRLWRFIPARRNGNPVAASVHVPIRFALQ